MVNIKDWRVLTLTAPKTKASGLTVTCGPPGPAKVLIASVEIDATAALAVPSTAGAAVRSTSATLEPRMRHHAPVFLSIAVVEPPARFGLNELTLGPPKSTLSELKLLALAARTSGLETATEVMPGSMVFTEAISALLTSNNLRIPLVLSPAAITALSESMTGGPANTGLKFVTTGAIGFEKSTCTISKSLGPEATTTLSERKAIDPTAVLGLEASGVAAVPITVGALGLEKSSRDTRALKLLTNSPTATRDPRIAIAPMPFNGVAMVPRKAGTAGLETSTSRTLLVSTLPATALFPLMVTWQPEAKPGSTNLTLGAFGLVKSMTANEVSFSDPATTTLGIGFLRRVQSYGQETRGCRLALVASVRSRKRFSYLLAG